MPERPLGPRSRPETRAEILAVWRLAMPVVLANLGMMLMGTVDTMMLGRYSETALASGALGHALQFGFSVLPMGILMALDPLVAQAWGAGEKQRIARYLQRGLVLSLALSIPVCLLLWDTRALLVRIGQPPEVAAGTAIYLRAVIPGTVAFLVFVVLRQTLQAMSLVRPTVWAMVLANLFNALANWVLIYGHWGAPALGVAGAGWATSISRTVGTLAVLALAWPILRPYWVDLGAELRRWKGYDRILRLGVPIGLHISIEFWFFTVMALLMGKLGTRELAAHQIALNLGGLSFMVPLGIGAAAATRVGNAVGRRDMPGARRTAAVCLVFGGSIMSIAAILFWTFPELLARAYTSDPELIAMAALLLPIAALFQLFDGLQAVAGGVLRGAADTRVPAILALVCFWGLGLPLALVLAFRLNGGPQGLWWGITTGLGTVAIVLLLRARWRFARPIEAIVADDD